MATSGNKREVQLEIGVSTSGTDALKSLRSEVANLAKEGGDAAPEFQRLGAELDRIAASQNAIDTFANLKRETVDLGIAMTTAAADVDRLGAQLPGIAANTQIFVQAQTEAKVALQGQKALLDDNRAALEQLKNENVGAARGTDEYKIAAANLKETIAQLKINVAEANTEYKTTVSATRDAATEERKLTAEFNASLNTAKELSSQLNVRNTALATSRQVLQENGVETTKLNQAQAALKQSFADVTTILEREVTSLTKAKDFTKQLAEAEQLLQSELSIEAIARQAALLDMDSTALLKAADSAKQLAQAQGLLNTELELAAITRQIASLDQEVTAFNKAEASAKQLAVAEKLLQSELEIQSASRIAAIARENEAEVTRAKVAQESAAALVRAAREAGAALDAAFSATGVRSTQAIQAEIAQINESLTKLASNARVSGADFDRAFASAQSRVSVLQNELKGLPETIDKSSTSLGYLRQQFSQLAAIYGGIQLGQAFIDANVQIETLRRTLTFVTGSSAEAAKQIALLQDVSNKTGVSVGGLSDSFVRFQSSAGLAGLNSKVIQDLFVGIATAGGKMGLSTDRVALSLEAVSQIASKGVVSMEELRGQLGDSLPGAMNIAARSVGLTVSQFTKLVETGQVLSEDFLPAFAAEFKKTFGDGSTQIDGFIQSWNRLKNSITQVAQQAADSSAFKALATTMDFLAKNMQTVVDGAYALGKAFIALKAIQLVGEFTGITAALQSNAIAQERNALAVVERTAATRTGIVATEAATAAVGVETAATNVNTAAKKANALAWGTLETNMSRAGTAAAAASTGVGVLGTAVALGSTALRGFASLVGGLPGIALAIVVNAKEIGTWIGETAAQWTLGSKAVKEYEDRLKNANEEQARAVVAAKTLPPAWLQISAAFAKTSAEGEKHIVVLEKLAVAAKTSADNSVKLAQLTGDEAVARSTAATSALNLVDAYQKVSNAQQAQLDLLLRERNALIEAAGGEDKLNQAKKDALKTLDDKIEKQRAETAQSVAATNAAKDEAAQRTLLVQTTLDNSKALDTLREAYLSARGNAERLTQAVKDGWATQEQANDAQRKAAVAQGIYNDALKDTVAALDRKTTKIKEDLTLTEASLNLQKAQASASEQIAILDGNDELARQARIKSKQIEIKIVEAKIAAAKLEAQAIIATAEAEKAELIASGNATEAKIAAIDASIQNAKVKQLEAQASEEAVKVLQKQLDNLIQYGEVSATARNKSKAAIEGETGALGANTAAQNANAAAINQVASASASLDKFNARNTSTPNDAKNVIGGGSGFGTLANSDGQVNVPAGSSFDYARYQRDLAAYFKTVGTSAPHITAPNPQDYVAANPTVGAGSHLAGNGTNAGTSLYGSKTVTPSAASSSSSTSTPTVTATSTTHTVNVSVNGQTSTVNTASAADSNTLVNLLKSLESAARSSGTQVQI